MAAAARALRKVVLEDRTPPIHNLPAGHIWKYSKSIGGGAQGKAHLWVHLDETQKIVDRIVIKNFVAESKYITEDGPTGRVPTEAYISQLLVPDNSKEFYTVPILACQPISGSTGGWRTYSPYYSLGNFENLVNKHTTDSPLPEAFLWFFFHRMAKALVVMDETLRKDDKGPVIIHNDIKPDNIFLGSPGSLGKDADFIMYPPAYLGDFGLAFTTHLGDQGFAEAGGAFGWWPPEHHTNEEWRGRPFSSTNVWQIGFLILCAMNGITDPDQPNADAVLRYDAGRWEHLTEDGAFAGYSDSLQSLVHACLCSNPSDRIDPQSLLFLVENSMAKHIDDMQRWGTISWIDNKHNETSGDGGAYHPAVASDEHGEEGEEAQFSVEDGDFFRPPSHRKRKSSYPDSDPGSKRLKRTSAVSREILQRRYALVAKQMQLGKTSQTLDAHPDDTSFILADGYKLKHYRDEEFDPEAFFSSPDPGPVKYMTVAEPPIQAEDNEDDVLPGSTAVGDGSSSGSTFRFTKKDIPYVELD
ncbi:kinase-like protein, partial [Aureobasidium melanogenum]|uniref:non-specific serine/threonine protein kinase n=1 Tax=Aureobasidium melanogenum (strain CBS 110374) TaxID=1043003 RepID=A0A074WMP8_AURM1